MKKYKVTFLLDKSNLWIEKQLKSFNFNLNKKFIFKFSKNSNKVINQDIVFPISYLKILPENFIEKNKMVLIAHPSKLPKGRGFAPVQYEVLNNKNIIYISLIKGNNDKVDSGPICIQDKFLLNGLELSDEIRYKQGKAILKIVKNFLKMYPKVKFKKQRGRSSFNKRRHPKDSELNINKSIKDQFNHMRINDNKKYPSFFIFKKKKFILKIFEEDYKK